MQRPDPSAPLRRALVALALLVTTVAPALPLPGLEQAACAQQDRRKAKKAYNDARKAYSDGDFATAAEQFKQAYSYDPKPQLLFNIGQSLKEAGELNEAVGFFTRYLEEVPKAPNRDQVLETIFTIQQEITARKAYISVETTQPGLDIFVNDATEPQCKSPCNLELDPGQYTLTLRGAGFMDIKHELEVKPQEEREITLEPKRDPSSFGTLMVSSDIQGAVLVIKGKPAGKLPLARPLSLEPGSYPAAVKVGEVTRWSGTLTVKPGQHTQLEMSQASESGGAGGGGSLSGTTITGLTLIGVGASSLLAGTLFGLSANSIESDLADQRSRNERPNPQLISQGEDQALYANLFYGVGVSTLITGLLLWTFDDGGAEGEQASAGLDPYALPEIVPTKDGAVVRMRLRF